MHGKINPKLAIISHSIVFTNKYRDDIVSDIRYKGTKQPISVVRLNIKRKIVLYKTYINYEMLKCFRPEKAFF